MDLIFQPTRGRPFTIEVCYFDTVLEIKEKVQKYQGIPVAAQTLVFNGNILDNDLNVHYSNILDRSHIQLIVAPDDHTETTHSVKAEESSSPNNPRKIQLQIKMPGSKIGVVIEVEADDRIKKLKEKIHEMQGLPINRLVLQANGSELHDHKTIHDSALMDRSEIEVSIRSSSTTTGSSGSSSGNNSNVTSSTSKKLRVVVLTKCGTKKIPMEVNPGDNVAELRRELQNLNQELQLELPPEGYFFIYKQNVMDDDRSFRWHHVGQGDIIEIFNGSVTGGL